MASYLITGGSGFIGSHLCESLLRDGHAVRVLDDLSSGTTSNLPPSADLVVGDIRDRSAVRAAMAGVDGCFHLAAVASVTRSVEEPALTAGVNNQGTVEVFAAALEVGVAVVYASSAAVCGRSCGSGAPLAEDAGPPGRSPPMPPRSSRTSATRALGESRGLRSFGLRFFNVYGPRQDPSSPDLGVISIVKDRAAAGAAITILGDGEQTRDFVHVSDVVSFLDAAMARACASAPVANVATVRAVTVRHLAETTARRSGVDIVHPPARGGDVRHSCGATQTAERLLGSKATISLENGL
jgi:UDP-glucose 4-epimerase